MTFVDYINIFTSYLYSSKELKRYIIEDCWLIATGKKSFLLNSPIFGVPCKMGPNIGNSNMSSVTGWR